MKDIFELIEDGKVKRYFRARVKPSFKGAVSHVTQRATGKELLFIEDLDYLYMLYLMKKISQKFNFCVLSFALMVNHIHLLLRLNDSNLSLAMKSLFESYAFYFNSKYKRKGHVFCGPYRSALCFDNNYLLAASLYIHFNPVRAKLVSNPIDYRWSSSALFVKDVKGKSFVDYKFILNILDDKITNARRKYSSLLSELDAADMTDALEKRNVLEFTVNILRRKLLFYNADDNKWAMERGLCGDSDLDEKIQKLKGKGRLRKPNDIKARRFIVEQLNARGFMISDIAKRLGVSRYSIYRIMQQK